MSDDPQVHLIVPTTVRDIEMVTWCLGGIIAYTKAVVCFVVNANSESAKRVAQGLWETLQRHCPNATAVFLPREVGYVNAVNLGWKCLNLRPIDYIGTLNDDVEVDGGFVTPLVQALEFGAAQAGPDMHHVGRDGFWGKGDEPYTFLEGWCWLAKVSTILHANSCNGPTDGLLYDQNYSPGYCEDCDLSIRLQRTVGPLQQVSLPLHHLRSQTFGGDREPFWSRNRADLVQKWNLGSDAA